jgi:4-diphosphocytidyl-2-C-methyl-D-erythritol kinase
MPGDAPLVVRAYAKVNLDLRILGLLADGYHEVRTVLQSVRLHDTLTFTRVPGPFTIVCADRSIPTDERNLIWRAADVLCQRAVGPGRRPAGIRVEVVKRIPAQAGLGGGSADAAAALLALARLWALPLDLATLARLAATLGADVPFFLAGGTALGTGRGDEISPLAEPPPSSLVLVAPPFGISTPDAYRWFDVDGPPHGAGRRRRGLADWPAWAADLGNDLEAPVVRRHPAIGRLVLALRRLGASYAAMSGSGSAVFGVFASRAAAAHAQAALVRRRWRAVHTSTLPRAAVARQRRRVLARH